MSNYCFQGLVSFLKEWYLGFKAPPSFNITLLFPMFCEFFATILNPWTLPTMWRNNEGQTHTISFRFMGFNLSVGVDSMELQLNKPCKNKIWPPNSNSLLCDHQFFVLYIVIKTYKTCFKRKRWWWHSNLMLKQWQNTYYHF